MRKRLDAPENRREIARQPSAKNQPRRAKCPAATNATEYFGIIGKFVKTTLTPQP